MHNEFTSRIEQDGEWFVGYCPQVPEANGQGRTPEECLENLTEAVALVLADKQPGSCR